MVDNNISDFKELKELANELKQEVEMLSKRGDYYLFHEHLEDINEPMYFHQFVKMVDESNLRYLADASFATMVAQLFDDSAAELLRSVPLLRREQYMDFLRNRRYFFPGLGLVAVNILVLALFADAGGNRAVIPVFPAP